MNRTYVLSALDFVLNPVLGKAYVLVKSDSYSVTIKRNTVREANVPVPFTLVDLEADAGVGWWMVYRSIENDEIRP